MKHLLFFCCLLLISINLHGQSFVSPTTLNEWNVSNTSSSPGERIVAIITQDTTSSYRGAELMGQIIDGNGNWGYSTPTVANFRVVVAFYPGGAYGIIQDVQTSNITLELKRLNSNQIALVANCSVANTQMRILYRFTSGIGTSLSAGVPGTVNSSGTMLVAQPTYQMIFSGNVLIGETSQFNPSYILDVNGIARAKGVVVNTTGADFVFAQSYKLSSLSNLEKYINRNHHLPEIASANQMQTEGLNLGDNQIKLLQKIEEQTLYTIAADKQLKDEKLLNTKQQAMLLELQKQLKAQQEQIDQLKQQMDTHPHQIVKQKLN